MAGVKFPEEEKKRLHKIAERRGQSFSELIRDGVEIIAGLPDEFLKQYQQICDATKLGLPTVFVQFLLVYAAQDAAVLKVYGHSNTYQRAFQFDQKGIISGDRLSKKIYNEVLKNAKDLKKRMIENAAGETENVFVSNADAAEVAIQMGAAQAAQ